MGDVAAWRLSGAVQEWRALQRQTAVHVLDVPGWLGAVWRQYLVAASGAPLVFCRRTVPDLSARPPTVAPACKPRWTGRAGAGERLVVDRLFHIGHVWRDADLLGTDRPSWRV